MKSFTIITALALPLLLISCKKEDSGSSTSTKDIEGTWKFVSISGISENTNSYQQLGSSFVIYTLYTYASTAASGTIVITPTNFNGQNIAYSASGQATTKMYEDGQLQMDYTSETPFSAPASNPTSTYKKIGSDSLAITGGTVVNVSSGTTTALTPAGYKYKIEGDKLTLNMNLVQNNTTIQSGLSVNQKINAKATMILQKQ